ncbi:hypothetical protein DRJ22_06060 [Candidatus Woesearchaeota archaeon]|nr:MAG: hypothetical protein DRJ22_06060 [Candidatus Woesearchaeota archaeon]
MNSESSHEPSELETIFKKIAEELDITLTKDNTSTEYSLWGSKDDDLIFSYSIGKNNKGSDLELALFSKEKTTSISITGYHENKPAEYLVQIKIAAKHHNEEINKIQHETEEQNPDLHLSNLIYNKLKSIGSPTEQDLKGPDTVYFVVITTIKELKGVKTLIYNQFKKGSIRK